MKLSTTLLAFLGVVVLVAAAVGTSNFAKEEALEIRNLLLKAEKKAAQLKANEDDDGDSDDDDDERGLSEDADDDDDDDDDSDDERGLSEDAGDDDSEDDVSLTVPEERGHGSVKYNRQCPSQFKSLKCSPTCASQSPNFVKGEVSRRDKRKIVKQHNLLRGQVSPKASDMLKLSWDNDLAVSAQRWAEKCAFVHTCPGARVIPGKFRFGENLAKNHKDWKSAIQAWFDEKNDFVYGKGSKNGKQVGHYTAMVWAKTYKIGCGFAECKGNNGRNERQWVCQYGPAGNVQGPNSSPNKPYTTASKSCGDCRKCKKNLCYCRSKPCKAMGQSKDPKTCKCV